MSVVETVADVTNPLLSRREITCSFIGLGGRLSNMEAIRTITKEYQLDGKVIIPIKLKNHVGQPNITGLFYVYDDEVLAKRHVGPVVLSRLEKHKAKETATDTQEK